MFFTRPVLRPEFSVPAGRVLQEARYSLDAYSEIRHPALLLPPEHLAAAGFGPKQSLRLFQYQDGWFLAPAAATKYSRLAVLTQGDLFVSSAVLGGEIGDDFIIKVIDGGIIIQAAQRTPSIPRAPSPSNAKCFGWGTARISAQSKRKADEGIRENKFVDLGGPALRMCGLKAGDLLRTELYDNRAAVFKDDDGTVQCRASVKQYPTYFAVRLNEGCFEGLHCDEEVVVIYGQNALFVVPSTDSLSEFGLSLTDKLDPQDPSPAHKQLRARPVASFTPEQLEGTSFYVLPQTGNLEVSGGWLVQYGFKPGQRYKVAEHPGSSAKRKRFLVVPDDDGTFEIGAKPASDEPALVLPETVWSQLPGAYARVMPTEEGLHIYSGNPRGIYG